MSRRARMVVVAVAATVVACAARPAALVEAEQRAQALADAGVADIEVVAEVSPRCGPADEYLGDQVVAITVRGSDAGQQVEERFELDEPVEPPLDARVPIELEDPEFHCG